MKKNGAFMKKFLVGALAMISLVFASYMLMPTAVNADDEIVPGETLYQRRVDCFIYGSWYTGCCHTERRFTCSSALNCGDCDF